MPQNGLAGSKHSLPRPITTPCPRLTREWGARLARGERGGYILGAVDDERKVLGHLAALHALDARGLELLAEVRKRRVLVQPCAVRQAPRPCKDGRDAVSARLAALLVHAEVPRHRPVRSLCLNGLPVGAHQHTSHEAQAAKACSQKPSEDQQSLVRGGEQEAGGRRGNIQRTI